MSDQPSAIQRPFALRSLVFTIAFLIVILGVVPSLFYLAGEWIRRPIDFWRDAGAFWQYLRVLLGAAVFATGLATYSACSAWLIFFGKGPHVEFDPPKVFVATGPYRWMRNPVAATLLLTVLGEAIFMASPGVLFLALVGVPIAHWQVTRIEEPRLRQRFGESYEAYCRKVPRWIPRPPQDESSGSGQ